MSLAILSEKFELQEETFKSIALASLNSKLDFSSRENSMRESGAIEIWVTKRFGNGEYDYDFFSMDIHSENHATNFVSKIKYKTKYYFALAGSDNTPSLICYLFSLAYLRIKPQHKIALYDKCIFGLDEIEQIEEAYGYIEDWAKFIVR
jgi:hypothetical protein